VSLGQKAPGGDLPDLIERGEASPTAIVEGTGVSQQVVYRVQDDPAKLQAMVAEWGM
jgi:hypothetical protein